jgi:hypothetical protein
LSADSQVKINKNLLFYFYIKIFFLFKFFNNSEMRCSKEFLNNSILINKGSRISLRYPRSLIDRSLSPLNLKTDNQISLNIYREKIVKGEVYDEKVKLAVKPHQKGSLSPSL